VNIIVIIVNKNTINITIAFVALSSKPGPGQALFSYKVILSAYIHWFKPQVFMYRSNMYCKIDYRKIISINQQDAQNSCV
jgi:hypothetical protein